MDENLLQDPKQRKVGLILQVVLSVVFLLGTGAIVFSVEYFASNLYPGTPIRVWADTFSVSGLLGIIFWALGWVSQKGSFDIIVYSTRKMFNFMFRIHPEKTTLPKTYVDYVIMRQGKKPKLFPIFIFSSLFVAIIGVVLTFVSLGLEY